MFPWEYFFSMKQERRGDKKRVIYLREVRVLMRFRNTLVREPPLQHYCRVSEVL
jgi:hypothetical protein